MKTPRLPALGISSLVLAASLLSGCGKSDSSASAASPPVTNAAAATAAAPAPGPGSRGRMHAMFDQLGLSDAQKQQIAQIRQTVTDRQQRREAIMNVLTPDQRAKLQQLRGGQSSATSSTNTPGTPPPNGT